MVRFVAAFIFLTITSFKSAHALTTVNQLLFEANGEAATLYDFKIFLKTKEALKMRDALTQFVSSPQEDFVVFILTLNEAKNLEIQADESEKQKKEFTDKEIQSMADQIYQVKSLLAIKDKQLLSKERLNAWLDVLKRKYAFVVKSNDYKTSLEQ